MILHNTEALLFNLQEDLEALSLAALNYKKELDQLYPNKEADTKVKARYDEVYHEWEKVMQEMQILGNQVMFLKEVVK